MCILCCQPEADEDSEKRQWWVRIAVTLLILTLIAGMVLASVLYRANKTKMQQELLRSEDDVFEKLANRTLLEKAEQFSEAPRTRAGTAVSAEYPICVETGSKILSEGGSAVDAGIAMLLCQGVVEPHHSGLGGGFLMMIYIRKTKQVVTLDARATAPFFATARMFERFNATQDDQFDNKERQGWLTVGVPGEGLGLWEAHKKYGKLPWQRLVDPAIRLASHGFPISNNLANYLALYNTTIRNDPFLKEVFLNRTTNETYKEGEDVVNEHFAKVLMRIASEGVEYLYKGDAADATADESLKGAGIFMRQDFSDYKVKWSYSLPHLFKDSKNRRYTLHMPPPPSCAIMIGMILNIVQRNEENLPGQNVYSQTHIAQFYHKIVEAMKHTFARRSLFGDSKNIPNSELYKFLSPHWGLITRELISPTNTFLPRHYLKQVGAPPSMVADSGTTNVAAVAANGDVIVASSSLNDPFGSGIVSSSLGFLLNNNMLTFTRTDNGKPIMGDFGNLVIPNKRPLTSLCPIIVLDDEENFRLLMAASGGVRIPTSIALVLMRYFWLDDGISKAARKYRFHHQLIPNTVFYEGPEKQYDLEYLQAYGHDVQATKYKWPHVNIIVQENGTRFNVKDGRDDI